MRGMRRLTALVLALVLAIGLTVTAHGAELPGQLDGAVVVLHTGGTNGQLAGYAKVSALKETYEAMGAYVLVVDAGNFAWGGSAVTLSQGNAAVEVMNLAGYDAAAVGSHELYNGYDQLRELEKEADFFFLCANAKESSSAVLDDHVVFTAPDGTKIGMFGLTAPRVKEELPGDSMKGLTFLEGKELITCAKNQVKALKEEECDFILCLSDLGLGDRKEENSSLWLLQQVSGIDVLIDGRSQAEISEIEELTNGTCKVGKTIVTSVAPDFAQIGAVVFQDDTVVSLSMPVQQVVPVDTEVMDRIQELETQAGESDGVSIARTEILLEGGAACGYRETNLGDLVTDAMIWKADELGQKADAAVLEAGAIGDSLPAGDISQGDLRAALPEGERIASIRITGAQLLEAMEAAAAAAPAGDKAFPQVSGITYTVDGLTPYQAGDAYEDGDYAAPEDPGSRLTITAVGDKKWNASSNYTILVSYSMAAGEGAWEVFSQAKSVKVLDARLDQAVSDYIVEELGGAVTAERYGETQGRIQVTGYADVPVDSWYAQGVYEITSRGLMDGDGDRFDPQGTMTRAMLVTALYRLSGSPEQTKENPFTDVPDDAWYADAVVWAAEQGIVTGVTSTTFQPDGSVTREQLAAILYRYDGGDGARGDLTAYPDSASVSAYAVPGLSWAVKAGIVTGSNGLLVPQGTATRAQGAAMLWRYLEMK